MQELRVCLNGFQDGVYSEIDTRVASKMLERAVADASKACEWPNGHSYI